MISPTLSNVGNYSALRANKVTLTQQLVTSDSYLGHLMCIDSSMILISYRYNVFVLCGRDASITIPYRLYNSVLPKHVRNNSV